MAASDIADGINASQTWRFEQTKAIAFIVILDDENNVVDYALTNTGAVGSSDDPQATIAAAKAQLGSIDF